ncbi:MAG: glycosyltransferase family 4 protein [Candidatus Krumholzibacteriia bacterium]
MQILYVCSDFGIPVYGHKGAAIHLRAMARALTDLGHRVCVLSPSTEREANLDFDVPVRTLAPPPEHVALTKEIRHVDKALGTMLSGHEARVGQEVRNLLYGRTVAQAGPLLDDLHVDFVYERYALLSFGGGELARNLGVPHLLEVNAPLVLEQQRARGLQLRDLALEIEHRVWRQADALLVVSAELRDHALETGVAPERVHVVPNGVDACRFVAPVDARARARAEIGLGTGPVIGFVGSLKTWHGTDVLLQAFAALRGRHPDAVLLFVGDGPMRQRLEQQAAGLGVASRVRFTGAVDHTRVPELLAAMDVATAPYLPSEDFYFSPIKVYEYMAAGLPVVASRIGQVRELTDAGWVTAVEPGDVAALEQALERLLDDPRACKAQAERAREWALRERTWSANARRLVGLGTSLIAART